MHEAKILEKQKDFISNLLIISQVANHKFLLKLIMYLLFVDVYLQLEASKSLSELKWESLSELGPGSVVIFLLMMSFFMSAVMPYIQQGLEEFFNTYNKSDVQPYDHGYITLEEANKIVIEDKDDSLKGKIEAQEKEKEEQKLNALDCLTCLVLVVVNFTVGWSLAKQTIMLKMLENTIHFPRLTQVMIFGVFGTYLLFLYVAWWRWVGRNRTLDRWIYAKELAFQRVKELDKNFYDQNNAYRPRGELKHVWIGWRYAYFLPTARIILILMVGGFLTSLLQNCDKGRL